MTGVPKGELVATDFSDYFTDPLKAREGYREVFEKGLVKISASSPSSCGIPGFSG